MSHLTRADRLIIRPSDIEPELWVNGRGATRVMAERTAWRISIAEIEGRMPFSFFPGMERVLVPLSAGGVGLEIEDERSWILAHSAVSFRGEDRVIGQAGRERTTVVNVMTRRSIARLDCEIRRGTDTGAENVEGVEAVHAGLDIEGVDAFVVLDGHVSVGAGWLPQGTVILPEGKPCTVSMEAGTVALLRWLVDPDGCRRAAG
jgi:environmental stress-induced protein Ves